MCFLSRCVYCFADRPADPYAKFCNVCGKPVPPLPQNRLPPPEPGQVSKKTQKIPLKNISLSY